MPAHAHNARHRPRSLICSVANAVFGIQKSGYCECDCQLVETARDIDDSNDFYKSALIFTFTHITNCWYNSTSGPVCNTKGDDRILVTEFC